MIIPNIREKTCSKPPTSIRYLHFPWFIIIFGITMAAFFGAHPAVSKKLPQEHTGFGSHIKWQGEDLGSFRMWAMRNIVILGKPQRSCWHQIQELDGCKTDDSESLNTMHIRTNDHRNCLPQWIWFPRCDSNFAWTLRVWSFVSWLAGKATSF